MVAQGRRQRGSARRISRRIGREDWAFALWPEATQEDLTSYWQRISRASLMIPAPGLIEIAVSAYTPEMSQAVTRRPLWTMRRNAY